MNSLFMQNIRILVSNTLNFLFRPSQSQGLIPLPIQELLQERTYQTTKFMIIELKTAILYNIILSSILTLYIPYKFQAFYHCDRVATLWVTVLCTVNFIGFIPKILFLKKVQSILQMHRQNSELLKHLLIPIFGSNIAFFNTKLSKLVFFMYIFGLLYNIVAPQISSNCRDSELNYLCYFTILGFVGRFILSYRNFKQLYFTQYLGNSKMELKDLNKLKTATVTNLMKKQFDENQLICIVCLEDYKENEKIKYLNCNKYHFFHKNCIDQWLQDYHCRCPVCNRSQYDEQLE